MFQCPSGHFLIQTLNPGGEFVEDEDGFQCPSGHFLIQTKLSFFFSLADSMFQCPSGHFLIQTWQRYPMGTRPPPGFNARQGIS